MVKCKNCVEEFSIQDNLEWYKCPSCGLIKIDGEPNLDIYNEKYSSRFEDVLSSTNGRLMTRFRAELIDYFVRTERDIYYHPEGEIVLDIGCGAGDVLQALTGLGYDVRGCEINSQYKPIESLKDNIYFGSFEEFFKGNRNKYVAVSMFDVLEHMSDPKATLHKVHLIMKPKGKLIISLPDVNQWHDELEDYKHYKPGEHIFLFGDDSLERMLTYTGFNVVHTCYFEDGFRHYSGLEHNIKTIVAEKET